MMGSPSPNRRARRGQSTLRSRCPLRPRHSRPRPRHHDGLGAADARRPDRQRHRVVPPQPLRRRRHALPALHHWLTELDQLSGPIAAICFEEVRRHAGTDAAHVYGGLMATLTAWAELRGVPYQGVPVGTIKRHATGKGNADKEAMIAAVRARGFTPADDNEADAHRDPASGRSRPAEVSGEGAADPRAHRRRRRTSAAKPTAPPARSWRRSRRAGRSPSAGRSRRRR